MDFTHKNTIIANWLGWTFDEWNMLNPNGFTGKVPYFKQDLKFQSDWNWLMFCLKKIAKERKKTLFGAMEIVGYTLSKEFRTIDSISDLYDAIFNYIATSKSDF